MCKNIYVFQKIIDVDAPYKQPVWDNLFFNVPEINNHS